jgi:hypothetical protein
MNALSSTFAASTARGRVCSERWSSDAHGESRAPTHATASRIRRAAAAIPPCGTAGTSKPRGGFFGRLSAAWSNGGRVPLRCLLSGFKGVQSDGMTFTRKVNAWICATMEKTVLRAGPAGARAVREGDEVTVDYVGRVKDGAIFDSSHDRGRPLTFLVGGGTVIKGWEQSLPTMRVGEVESSAMAQCPGRQSFL